MPLNLDDKKLVVSEVAAVAESAYSAIAAEYRGLSVGEMTELRAKARSSGVYLRVVKNTLARRAVAGTQFECMQEGLVGPLLLAFSRDDPGAAARLIKDFAKSHDKLNVKLVAIGGSLLAPSEISRVADLPTREQALSILLGTIKAPIQKMVSTLNEVPSKLARTLAAIRDQKQDQG